MAGGTFYELEICDGHVCPSEKHANCQVKFSPLRSSHFFHELIHFVLLIVAVLLEVKISGLLQLKAD